MHPKEDDIHAYIEHALDASARADVERHLEECADCKQLAADLAEIRQVASSLDLREPPARVWLRIERAIELEGRAERGGVLGASRAAVSRISRYAWLAAAAALVLATAVGLRYGLTSRRASPTDAQPVASAPNPASSTDEASAEAVEAELRAAEAHYERAIRGLEQIAGAGERTLDPKTATTLQKNLAVIDQAINESRAAVRAEPSSAPAANSLMENFKTKLALLQDTVALINEMRKGNEAGTARIVSGLKEKGD
jgi:anti-sigma factor RsiW